MKLPSEKSITQIHDLKIVAHELSQLFQPGDVVVLNGNLGTGKTTLVKHICGEYGINDVNSPSFSIVNEYIGKHRVYHFDFYRLKKITELYDIGFEEYLNDDSATVFIEWGNLFKEILPSTYFRLDLQLADNNDRKIFISKKN